jgi:hypothetical protein
MEPRDPHQTNLKGLQLNAKYSNDITREWALCKANQTTLEVLSISDASIAWNLEPVLTFPKLNHLSIFIQGMLTVDNRRYKEKFADWKHVKEAVDSIQKWMLTHSFPALERVEILWSANVLVETIRTGGIEGYDRYGPIYDTDYNDDYEYISMDAVLYHFARHVTPVDFKWMNALSVKELHLSRSLYEAVDTKDNSFPITCADDFTQEEENELFEKIRDY